YFIRAYVNGSLTVVNKTGTGSADISGEFYIASGEKLGIGESVTIHPITDFNVVIQGTIVVDDKNSDIFNDKYVGASYSITVKDGTTDKSKTLYYTTFDAAIASISEADDKTIFSTITKIESDFTVAADQVVEFNAAKVASKNTVTVESDGTVKGITTVEGKVIVKDGATCSIPSTGYAAKTVSADNTITYAGLKIAIENATSGDVITISSGETEESLTIPAGVTVTVSNNLKVKGDLVVSEGAALIIKGTLTMTSTVKDVTTDVIGTLDVSDGTYVQGTKATLKSTGTTILQTTADVEFNGAYYNDSNGNAVITTVSKAVAGAAAAGEDTVTINGTVSESTEITLKDMTLALAEGAIVKLGTVKLENSTVDADATDAKLTATVVGMNGDADKAVSSSVKTSESNIVIVQTSTVKADETISNKFTISDVSGTVTVASGNVNFATNVSIAEASKDKLVVNEGATLTLDNDMTVDGGVVVIDGTVDVVGKKLTLNSEKAEINGTVNITKNGEVVLKKALVNGTIDVKTEKDKTNKLTISTDKFAFGKPIESIGASAVIIGNVDIPTNGSIVAYPGVDLSQAVFNADIDGKSTAVTTTYTINGVEYATVYALENNTVEVSSIFTPEQVKKVAGLDFTGITALTWKDVQGETANTAKIGEVDTVGIDVPVAKKKITVSVGTGISLYIDGVKYASGSEPSLTVGEHKVTATVNPGYKGTVDIMVNGVKITTGVFTVALDVDTVVSATGDITIDSGSTEPVEKDDSGMGITDYLLIVLVVLAAILVVIVAIRMMRS
ncbi:MAG: hypothetical protein IJX35_00505, partial [Candidatus Methanomethylophilaceae archaeon]|nr:hypothetical protein [Candidatus Methanomethylophilaceae archaeon]